MAMKTVYTVTLNPAWDRTAEVCRLVPGGTNLLREPRGDAGGKGINVSRVLHAFGHKTMALGLLGSGAGDQLLARLQEEGICCDFIRLGGSCRTNLKVVDRQAGVTTEFNEPGPQADAAALNALEQQLAELSGGVVVLAGSLPPGVPVDWYARAAALCRRSGGQVVLDASGEGLRRGLVGGPDAVKPNKEELEVLCGMPLAGPKALIGAARRQLLCAGVRLAAISLGAKGAFFVTGTEAVEAAPPEVEARSTVGAGDTMTAVLAEYLAARPAHAAPPAGEELRRLAARAVAAATAKVLREGTQPPREEEIATVAAKVLCRAAE